MSFLNSLLLTLIKALHTLINNYALTIIVFTILIKLEMCIRDREKLYGARDVEYTVCALVELPNSMSYRYSGIGYDVVLSVDVYKRQTEYSLTEQRSFSAWRALLPYQICIWLVTLDGYKRQKQDRFHLTVEAAFC